MKKIKLTQGKYALVDNEDFKRLNKWHWQADKYKKLRYYAIRGTERLGVRRKIYMHREILGLKYGNKFEADHINHNTLDNRRKNLRKCTHQENLCNSYGKNGKNRLSGIFLRCNRYIIYVKTIYGGYWKSMHKAIKYRNCMVRILDGEFAHII